MKRWQERSLWIVGTIIVMYAMVYGDVMLRARSAYREGEKYWQWADHPELKANYLNAQYAKEKTRLDDQLSAGKILKDDYDRSLELAQFDREQGLKESSIKYAYVWYQTAVELFSPPDSKWVELSRAKMPLAKERWKAELRAKGIPFEDYMID